MLFFGLFLMKFFLSIILFYGSLLFPSPLYFFYFSLFSFVRTVDSHHGIITRYLYHCYLLYPALQNKYMHPHQHFTLFPDSSIFLTILSETLYPSIQTIQSQVIQSNLCSSHNPENMLSVKGPHIPSI